MCSGIPRFSYGCLKTVICACPRSQVSPPAATSRGAVPGYSRVGNRVGIQGGYTGWVSQGVLPSCSGRGPRQRSGPRKPCIGAGVGGLGARANGRAGTAPGPPCGPGRSTPWPSLSWTLRMPSLDQRATFNLISCKVS